MTQDRAGQETEFRGVVYRSRTEARWAAFLTALDVSFVYEPRRYTLSTGETYLPDFWIKQFRAFLEVKPSSEDIRDAERRRMEMFARERQDSDLRFWISRGAPNSRENYIEDLSRGWGGAQIVGYRDTGLFLKNRDEYRRSWGTAQNLDKPEYLTGEYPSRWSWTEVQETPAIRRAYLASSTLSTADEKPRATLQPIFRQPIIRRPA